MADLLGDTRIAAPFTCCAAHRDSTRGEAREPPEHVSGVCHVGPGIGTVGSIFVTWDIMVTRNQPHLPAQLARIVGGALRLELHPDPRHAIFVGRPVYAHRRNATDCLEIICDTLHHCHARELANTRFCV